MGCFKRKKQIMPKKKEVKKYLPSGPYSFERGESYVEPCVTNDLDVPKKILVDAYTVKLREYELGSWISSGHTFTGTVIADSAQEAIEYGLAHYFYENNTRKAPGDIKVNKKSSIDVGLLYNKESQDWPSEIEQTLLGKGM
jgi:hypothetical protein